MMKNMLLNNKAEMQRNSENITQEIDTVGIIIYGKQGHGKTLLAICMAMDWKKRIYSNFDIFQDWKRLWKKIESVQDVKNIRFSYTPWIIIIDEAWINANSKDTRNKDNRDLQEILFLVRKRNCSLIWIAQRFESIDINARVLSEMILKTHKIRRWNKHPIFIITKQKQVKNDLKYLQQYSFDSIQFLKEYRLTYNTLENSKFNKKIENKKEDNDEVPLWDK